MNPARIVAPLVLVAAGYGVWRYTHPLVDPDAGLVASGTVEATDAQLGFQSPGSIAEIAVREGDRIEVGAEIARLESSELEARRAQAAAQVEAAKAQAAELEAGSRPEERAQARAAVQAAGDRVADAERDLGRAQTLFAGKAVSREVLDKATVALDLARSAQVQAEEALRLVDKGPRRERIAAAQAAVAAAEAAVATLDATLAKTRLVAPFAGVVTVRHREPGEIVGAGSPVVTLTNLDDRWVRIYVPEDRLGGVQLGQAVTITADTFPDRTYEGAVAYLASEAEFTPKNVQTSEERVRLVYAVKVRITGDPARELKPGLPADVRLDHPEPSPAG